MSARIGMDAGIVRQSAAAIDGSSRGLDQVVGSVDGLVAHIAQNWFGTDAAAFHDEWIRLHRPALTALATALHEYAGVARTHAAAQDRASEASGVSSAGGRFAGLAGVVARGNALLESPWLEASLGIGGLALGLMEHVPKDVGRYPKAWTNVLREVPKSWNNVLRYKQWGMVHELNHFRPLISGAGNAMTLVGLGIDGYSAISDAQHGDYGKAVFDGATVVADGAKSFGPLGYASGVALQAWIQAGKAAEKVDWSSQGMSEIWQASPKAWADAIGETAGQWPGQLLKIFG